MKGASASASVKSSNDKKAVERVQTAKIKIREVKKKQQWKIQR